MKQGLQFGQKAASAAEDAHPQSTLSFADEDSVLCPDDVSA